MTQEQMNEIKAVVNNTTTLRRFEYLCDRWQDEKDYEDFNAYAEDMSVHMPEGATLVKGTKRPFGIVINYGGCNIHIFLKRGNGCVWLAAKYAA
jgi:hypothetical protein